MWFVLPQIGAWPLILALFPWLLRLVWSKRLTRRTPFDFPLALFLLTAALGVWSAYNRDAAWSKFWLIVGAVLLFYAFANARATPAAVRAGILTTLAVGLSLYFLATNDWTAGQDEFPSMARFGQSLQQFLPAVPGPRLNPNEVGGLLAMMLPFVAWSALRPWQRAGDPAISRKGAIWLAALLGWGALALVLLGLLMTGSRGAWLAGGVTGLLAGLWWAARWLKQGDTRWQRWIVPGILAVGLAAGIGIGLLWLIADQIPLTQLIDPSTWLNRLEFQRNSLTLVKDYPLIGAGLDGFEMLYSTYVLLLHVGYISHSHNLFLGVAIDQGLPGLLALVWMWGLFALVFWHSVARPEPGAALPAEQASLAGLAAMSLLIILLHGTVDTALYGRGVLFLFVPMSFVVQAERQEKRVLRQQRALGLAAIGLPLGLALLWPGTTASLAYSNLGSVHQSQAELSLYSWPEWPIQDEVRRQIDLSVPISEFEEALTFNPRNATANRRLGMIELSLGQYEDALARLEAAYAAEPNATTTRQLLGEALIVNGRLEEGQALWSDIKRDEGQLEARVYWYEHIGDVERAAWVRLAADNQ
ncbi:MAG: O-antigen ligase family protein [Anaerolineae bacterium]